MTNGRPIGQTSSSKQEPLEIDNKKMDTHLDRIIDHSFAANQNT